VRDADGRVLYYEGTNHDITARKFAEAVLRESEEKFRTLFEFAPIGIALHNRDGRYLQANRAYQEMLGYTQKELLELGVRRITYADDVEEGQRLFRDLCEGRQDHYDREKRYWAKDAHLVWAHSSASAVRDDKGRLRYIISMVEDITERKRSEEALARTQRLQKAILDNIPDPAWLKDAHGRFLACNEPLARFFGQTPEAIIGRTVFDFAVEGADRLNHSDEEVLRSSKRASVEESVADAQGRVKWFETIKSPVIGELGEIRGTVGIAREVTERKWAEGLLQVQRDFGTFLGSTNDLKAVVARLLETAVKCEGIDCGGVYLVDEKTGELNLAGYQGLSSRFAKRGAHFKVEPVETQVSSRGQRKSAPAMAGLVEALKREGLLAMEVIPIQHAGSVVAVLNLGSHLSEELPARSCQTIEAIAAQAGGAIARIRAEQSLRTNKQLLEKTLHSLQAAVFIIDAETMAIQECNPAATRIFGYPREELIGHTTELLHLDEAQMKEFTHRMHAGRNHTEALSEFELQRQRKDGTSFPTENSLMPIRDETGRTASWVSVVRDITDIKRAEEELRQVSRRIIEAQEAERSRLAQEVHDGPAQALSNSIFQVEYIEGIIEKDSQLAQTELRFLRELLRRELSSVRTFISQLRPPVLDELGLDGAIRDAVGRMTALTGLAIHVELTAPAGRLPEVQQTVVLRVVQEALQNVRKHSGASSVVVASDIEGDDWLLTVRDDGRGFDVGAVAARGRRNFGLQFMQERAELIGARFEVHSRPEGGTLVQLSIPVGAEENRS